MNRWKIISYAAPAVYGGILLTISIVGWENFEDWWDREGIGYLLLAIVIIAIIFISLYKDLFNGPNA